MTADASTARPLGRICVFCGSNPGNDPAYRDTARSVGQLLASRGITLVYGGGRIGMMGAVAEGALAGGGKVIGVIPEGLRRKELAYDGVTELIVTTTMHERKQRMANLADGFIALPGGFGTFEEFCEILTWGQLGIHEKPCGLLSVKGYYAPLLALFDHAVAEGFLKPAFRQLVLAEEDPHRLLEVMAQYRPPTFQKWLTPETA